jgi:hypothetical protein
MKKSFATFFKKSGAKNSERKISYHSAMKPSKISNSLRSNSEILHGFYAA